MHTFGSCPNMTSPLTGPPDDGRDGALTLSVASSSASCCLSRGPPMPFCERRLDRSEQYTCSRSNAERAAEPNADVSDSVPPVMRALAAAQTSNVLDISSAQPKYLPQGVYLPRHKSVTYCTAATSRLNGILLYP